MRARWLLALLVALTIASPLHAAEKLNLNTATKAQLIAVGLTESQALQVIAHREKNGPFLQVEELLAVEQMKRETFERIRKRVTVDE